MNLEDVAGLTKLADSAQQTLPAIVADIPASCQRVNRIINDFPVGELPANLQLQDCKPYQDVADQLSKDQNVLIAYLDALGKLSSNAPLSYDQNIDTNVTTIGKIPNLSKNTLAANTAAQKITKVLADAITRSFRQHKVDSIIENTDDAVQGLTTALKKTIIEDYFEVLLADENNCVDTFYKSPIAAAGTNERLALVVVQRQYDDDIAALQARRAAAKAYGKIMDNLALLHAKLKAEVAKKANFVEIAKQIGPLIANLKDAISQLQTEKK